VDKNIDFSQRGSSFRNTHTGGVDRKEFMWFIYLSIFVYLYHGIVHEVQYIK